MWHEFVAQLHFNHPINKSVITREKRHSAMLVGRQVLDRVTSETASSACFKYWKCSNYLHTPNLHEWAQQLHRTGLIHSYIHQATPQTCFRPIKIQRTWANHLASRADYGFFIIFSCHLLCIMYTTCVISCLGHSVVRRDWIAPILKSTWIWIHYTASKFHPSSPIIIIVIIIIIIILFKVVNARKYSLKNI